MNALYELPPRPREPFPGATRLRRLLRRVRELPRHPRWRDRWLPGLALACLGLALALARLVAGPQSGVPTALVADGPFEVTLLETGTLRPLRSASYGSSIQSNQAKIVALAPEGSQVQKGDLLILFDATPFEEEIRRSEAATSQAAAELQKARQDLRLQEIENAEELAAARQRSEQSALELKDATAGQGLVKEEESARAVVVAERELLKAQTAYDDLKPLLSEGFITRQELERALQQVDQAREELALARQRHAALVDYGRPLELSQARAGALSTRETERQRTAAAASKLTQRSAAIEAAESRLREASDKLALARQQLARTEVRAEVPGIVVYNELFFGSDRRRPQVGDQVWANQALLTLPDVSRMLVETRVRETDVHRVAPGQQVRVRVDAFPALRLAGRVRLIGTLATEDPERRGSKFFAISVELDGTDARLRPGMTARVEIGVERRAQALRIPLEAVFEKEGRLVCFVAGLRGFTRREVVLGPSNRDFVVVESGLRASERVALYDPESAEGAPAGLP